MKRFWLLLSLVSSFSLSHFACTTFVIQDENNLVFGRNLDWVSDNGLIAVNKRGVRKRALVFPPDQPAEWISKYGSVTFNQFGKEFPYGGINEKGLVVEIMVVSGQYPKQDQRKVVNELQWVQYQLDNCETIEEVIESNKDIRISKVSQDLHFLVCDSTGNVAVIEFMKGKEVAYYGEDLKFPVLENSNYETSLWNHEHNKKCRFNTAVNLIEQYDQNAKENIIDYSFDILNDVKLDGSWSIVYDIKNKRVHFTTSSDRRMKFFALSDFSFECNGDQLAYDLRADYERNVGQRFDTYSRELNKQKFDDGLKTNGLYLPSTVYSQFINYPEQCTCEDS
jgi:choloylglycine hydrolase